MRVGLPCNWGRGGGDVPRSPDQPPCCGRYEPMVGMDGVWPLAVGLALVTLSVVLFPDGRLPSRAWYPVLGVGVSCSPQR